MRSGDLFGGLPDASERERLEALLARPGIVIERIVSGGHASPAGFWYDQADDEWTALLRGTAVLEEEGKTVPVRLTAGEWLFIPAGLRHRVKEVSPDAVWLAVHMDREPRVGSEYP